MRSSQRWIAIWMVAAITIWGLGNSVLADSPFFQQGINAIYEKYSALGNSAGFLGNPASDPSATSPMPGVFQHFDGGSIYWSPTTEAHEVHGAIRDKWRAYGLAQGYGFPLTDELVTPDGRGRYNHFTG